MITLWVIFSKHGKENAGWLLLATAVCLWKYLSGLKEFIAKYKIYSNLISFLLGMGVCVVKITLHL